MKNTLSTLFVDTDALPVIWRATPPPPPPPLVTCYISCISRILPKWKICASPPLFFYWFLLPIYWHFCKSMLFLLSQMDLTYKCIVDCTSVLVKCYNALRPKRKNKANLSQWFTGSPNAVCCVRVCRSLSYQPFCLPKHSYFHPFIFLISQRNMISCISLCLSMPFEVCSLIEEFRNVFKFCAYY